MWVCEVTPNRPEPEAVPATRRTGTWLLLAFIWGIAEATVFFVVPDVLITALALRSRRTALLACVAAVTGALLGGAITYAWGRHDPLGARQVFDHLPAIGPAMMDGVARDLRQMGALSILAGPIVGVPYKLFAAQAAAAGFSLPIFLLISIPARGMRFVLLALLTHAAAGRLRPRIGSCAVVVTWAVLWSVNYGLYWTLTPG